MPRGTNAPKLWPAEPREVDVDRVVGQAGAAAAPGDLGAEHRADGAVDVADRQLDARPARRRSSAGRQRSISSLVERPVEAVVLARPTGSSVCPYGLLGHVRGSARGRGPAPSSGRRPRGCRAPRRGRWPRASERKPELGQQLAHLLGDELEEVDDELGLAGEAARAAPGSGWRRRPGRCRGGRPASSRSRDTTSGAVAKPNSSAPSSAAITTSRPVFSWPSACTTMRSRRPLSSSVCCVSARPSSHGAPACLSEVSGEAPVPPSWPEMSTTSAWALRHAGGHRADADLGHQLHVDAGLRVGVLQVVDELLEVLDGVDVVVRRRADQPDARAWSAGSWRSTGTPCGRAAGRPRPAWRPGPS